ncbi:hypothetical protein D3C83_39920 [compost metagenome]
MTGLVDRDPMALRRIHRGLANGGRPAHELLFEHALKVLLRDRGGRFLCGEQRSGIDRIGDRGGRESCGQPRQGAEIGISVGAQARGIKGKKRLALVHAG